MQLNEMLMKSDLLENGYTAYGFEDGERTYAFIITPSDNVLYVEDGLGGINFAFEYVPSQNNGSCCQCLVKPVGVIDTETVMQAEQEGYLYARKLNATLYRSSKQWLERYWDKKSLVELAPVHSV